MCNVALTHVEVPRARDAIKLNNDGVIKLGYNTVASFFPGHGVYQNGYRQHSTGPYRPRSVRVCSFTVKVAISYKNDVIKNAVVRQTLKNFEKGSTVDQLVK